MRSLLLSAFLAVASTEPAFAGTLAATAAASGCTSLPCNESTTSLGQFIIQISSAFQPYFAGVQGYDSTSGIFVSPLLFDSNTVIGLSPSYTDGSRPASVTVGVTGTTAGANVTAVTETGANAPTGLPAGYPTGQDAISTAVLNASLTNSSGITVNIGAAAAGTPVAGAANLGEVEASNCSNNVPAGCSDFPAQSFFDIFADVTVPGLGSFSNPLNQPLIVSSMLPAPGSLPPMVVYVHGQSSSVNLVGDPNNMNFAGDTIGTFVLTGHGVAYNSSAVSEQLFGGQLMADVNADSALNTEEKTFIDGYLDLDGAPEPSTFILLFSGAATVPGLRRLRRSH